MPDAAAVREELELSPAFARTEDAYAAAREHGRCWTEDPEALLADFLAERHFDTLEAARVFMERLAAREAERRTKRAAEEDEGDEARPDQAPQRVETASLLAVAHCALPSEVMKRSILSDV